MMPPRPMTESADRSMPPPMMTNAIPMEIKLIRDSLRSRFTTFSDERKLGFTNAVPTHSTTSMASTPMFS